MHVTLEEFDWPAELLLENVEDFVQQKPVQTTPSLTWRACVASTPSSSSAPLASNSSADYDYYMRLQRRNGGE